MEHRLSQQIDKVAVRVQRLRLWRGLTTTWLAAAAAASGLWAIDRTMLWRPTHAVAIVLAVAAAALALSLWRNFARPRDARWLAQQIEAAHPELDACLLTAIEQRPAVPRGRLGYLQESVVRQALAHAYGHAWQQVVPRRRIAAALVANLAAFALLVAALVGLSRQSAARSATDAVPMAEHAARGAPFSFVVEPGDTEVERGTSLLVLARFQGPTPSEATLVTVTVGNGLGAVPEPAEGSSLNNARNGTEAVPYSAASDGQQSGQPHRVAMSKSLDDPVFGGRIASVDGPLNYQVDIGGRLSETYHVNVFEYPRLVRADARLVYPGYTSLAERTISDVRTISAVEGTELTLICRLNKPVRLATLNENDAPPITLSPSDSAAESAAGGDAPQGPSYQATLRLEKSRRLKLHLVDAEGRENKHPVEFVIHVLPNKPPDVKLAFPARDIEVSPLEETDIKATARDDFGLVRQGLTYTLAGGEPTEVVLGANGAGGERTELAHVIRFEELRAEPDQLLSYHFWAEDIGPAGDTRRVESDMYFAEVRHFEEIFRQGQQPPGGQQQQGQQGGENAQAAEKLAQLQKDIISATWKLVRREPPDAPTDALADDAKLLHESQASAIEQVTELEEKLTDAGSKAAAAAATRSMREALDHLKQALAPAVAPLRPALAAEQAAYQALLKLRAREHQVVRGQQAGGGSGGGGRSQQQLQQLQLSNDENRYESERAAQSQSGLQDRETRQVLSRLSELARRQNDINDRLKELNAALEEARTEPEREEVRRQLKRLRDEQQQMLRDTDELRARMEQPENQERMSEARQQLDQTRDEVRRASEALDQEQVSQAAAAGARAEQDFQNLREDFRRQTSNRFNDEMREMRDDARQLDEREQEIGQRMSGEKPGDVANSLRDEHPPEDLAGELAEQRQRLDEMLERMRRTIDEAEPTEPLLAERLYDTARKLTEEAPSRALEAAERSLRNGLADDARDREQVARQSIGELHEGIERAAESVLGDDTEALRRARQELERLSNELGDEIDRNGESNDAGADRTAKEGSDETSPGSSRSGQKNGGQKNERERRLGQPRRRQQNGEQPRGADPENGQSQDGQSQDGREGTQQQAAQQEDGQQQGGQQQGEQQQGGQQQGGQQQGGQQEGGQQEDGQQEGGQQQGGQQQGGQQQGGHGRGGERRAGPRSLAGPSESGGGGALRQEDGARGFAPLAGEDFLDWSDRLRDVEEMVGDPQLQAEAARIRERARGIRRDLKRHSQEPNWDLIKLEIAEPLAELRDRVAEELLRRTKQDALVPLDRDPVPPKYSEKTRRYYERLGSGEK